jgi:hypothetical protein
MNSPLYPLSRAVACVLALGLVATCAWKFGGGTLAEAFAEYRESRHWQQAMARAQAHSAELKAVKDRRWARCLAKDRIVKDLIAGRLNVNDAAWQYGDLPDAHSDFLEQLRETEQGASDHERLCWHLIDYACSTLESEAAQQELRSRLMQDFKNTFQDLRLPIPAVPVQ